MASIIQLRRDTAANWALANPVLAQGELGVETDTLKFKCGNGSSSWTSLSYLINTGNYLISSDVGSLVQGYDADLQAIASLAGTSGILTKTGSNTWTLDTSSYVLGTGGTASNITLNAGYTEQVFAVTGTTPALSPTNGSIQTWALTANSTPTAGTWNAGQSVTLMVNDTASSYQIIWTSVPVTWVGGSAPTLAPSGGYTIIQLWKVGTVIYGCLTSQVA